MVRFILYDPVFALAFFGSLSALAIWATRHNLDLLLVGSALVFCFVATNILGVTTPVPDQPGPYSAIQILISLTAVHAWAWHKDGRLVALVALSLASVCANIAFLVNFPPGQRQIFLWELTTNMLFAGECALASWVGIAHGYRIGRFRHRLRADRGVAQPDAARKAEP